jgi:hypothetical protein
MMVDTSPFGVPSEAYKYRLKAQAFSGMLSAFTVLNLKLLLGETARPTFMIVRREQQVFLVLTL